MTANILTIVFKLGILGTTLVSLYYLTKSKTIRRLIFVYLSSKCGGKIISKALDPHKRQLFSQLTSITSSDPKLAAKGTGILRILEIGIGSGSNLKYYPAGSHLIAIEPNVFFEKHFKENANEFDSLVLEKCFQASAEDMIAVPSESIDVVVSTHVLCSVSDLKKCLEEIHRILVPGGNFFFVEHTSFEDGYRRLLQRLSEPFWSFFSDGCQLSRNFDSHFNSAGFTSCEYKSVMVNGVFYVMRPHIIGTLTK